MKKNRFLVLFSMLSSLAHAQYFEGFENGVPGSMTQTFLKGETTFINFGLSALNVEKPLAEKNSAVFFNAMASKTVVTALQTPILNLTDSKVCLEFKYLQRPKTTNYANTLSVQLSNDKGETWQEIAVFNQTTSSMKTIRIALMKFHPSSQSCIKFVCTQTDAQKGFPIVIDDIALGVPDKKLTLSSASSDLAIYPNPSSGNFIFEGIEPLVISVYDTSGKMVYTGTTESTLTTVDLSGFPQGVYIAKINGDTTNETKKLIIEN